MAPSVEDQRARLLCWLELNLASGDGDARVRTNPFVDDERQLPVRLALWNLLMRRGDRQDARGGRTRSLDPKTMWA